MEIIEGINRVAQKKQQIDRLVGLKTEDEFRAQKEYFSAILDTLYLSIMEKGGDMYDKGTFLSTAPGDKQLTLLVPKTPFETKQVAFQILDHNEPQKSGGIIISTKLTQEGHEVLGYTGAGGVNEQEINDHIGALSAAMVEEAFH